MTDFVQAIRAAVEELPARLARVERTSAEWQRDPVAWASLKAGRFLWSKQRDTIEAVRDHSRVAVKSCHSTGKTACAATIAAWWIDSHEPGEAFVITTAPTGTQVKALLWREIGRLHRSAGLPGRVNLTEWYLGQEMVAFGRKSSDYDDDAFQGVHALYVLVILDEACGVASTLWTAAESIASNRHARILAIGNPDDPDSDFATVCDEASGWHTISIGYQDTPNFTGEDVPPVLRDLLISEDWVATRRVAWGEESALFQSKCAGKFPGRGADVWAAIQYGAVSRCRLLDWPDDTSELRQAGIDIGGGGDSTVLFERVGNRAGRWLAFKDPDPMATTGQLVLALQEWGITKAKIDVGGIGWGLYGRLRELSSVHNPGGDRAHDAEIVGVNFGSASAQPKRFLNKRAELWWGGRERSRLEQWDLGSLTDDVVSELCSPRYEILDSNGKVKIEKKEEVIKRLGRSPDFADALLLAFHNTAGDLVHANVDAVSTFSQANILKGGHGPSPFGDNSFRRR